MYTIGSKRLVAAALAAITLAAGLGATAARADSFNVYTGYADGIRSNGFFPTVWLGDANVVSQSPTGQALDAGAIRIQNTGATALSITNFTVTLNGGGTTFSPWTTLNIGVGQDGIFTQTFSYNFDSSDYATYGPAGPIYPLDPGGNGIGGCSSTAAAQAAASITAYCAARSPIVSFLANGTLFTLSDSGHILDTGNYDFVAHSPDGNESSNWNIIGKGAVRGGTGVPEPGAWSLMILGFGAAGAMLRRTRKLSIA